MLKVDVPERISRQAYIALIESLGLNPHDLRSLEFRMDGIYATVIARDANGATRVDGLGLVEHRVFIPVEDFE